MVNKKLLPYGRVDPELVKEYGDTALKYVQHPFYYHFATFIKEEDINLLIEKTRGYYRTPFYPGKREALIKTWEEVADRTGIICIQQYCNFLRKARATDQHLIMAYQVLKPGYKKCKGDSFHHVLCCYKGESSLWYVLLDYEEIDGIIRKNKSIFTTGYSGNIYIFRICKYQYNLCKRYGEQKRVDFLPIESEDVRNYIKTFL